MLHVDLFPPARVSAHGSGLGVSLCLGLAPDTREARKTRHSGTSSLINILIYQTVHILI